MADSDTIEVNEDRRDGATILHPVGDIDLARAASLRVALMQALEPSPDRLILDLAEVNYMDSSGVATFIEAMQVARRQDTALVLCNLQDRVRSIFEIARLEMVFKIVEDTDAALTA